MHDSAECLDGHSVKNSSDAVLRGLWDRQEREESEKERGFRTKLN